MNGISQTLCVRKIIGDILIMTSVLLIVDVIVIMLQRINSVVRKKDFRKVLKYELILCAILLLFALDIRFNLFSWSEHTVARIAGWVLRAVVVSLTVMIVFFCGKVVFSGMINNAGRADNAIVLGLALENGNPTDNLLARLNTAQAYLNEYPDARLILTGGNPDESGRTEAAVMRDILAEHGVAEDRMILEDQAESTKENFRNTARIIDPDKPVVLISSNYHMDRAVQTAKKAGFSHIMRLPAPSSFLCYSADVVCEVVLELNELTFKQ